MNSTNKNPSHGDHILLHLQSKDNATGDTRGITHLEALGLYRCPRLARVIGDLRDAGHKITSIQKMDITGRRYVKYFLSTNQFSYREGFVLSLPRNRRG